LDYIDSLIWPDIKGLLNAIGKYPPVDLFLSQMFMGKKKPEPEKKRSEVMRFPGARRGKVGVGLRRPKK